MDILQQNIINLYRDANRTAEISISTTKWQPHELALLSHPGPGLQIQVHFQCKCVVLQWGKQNPCIFVYKRQEGHPRSGFGWFCTRQASCKTTQIHSLDDPLASYRQKGTDFIYLRACEYENIE